MSFIRIRFHAHPTFQAFLMLSSILAGTASSQTPAAAGSARAEWDVWFEKNVTVTDRKSYVHIFWNAANAVASLASGDRRSFALRAARQLAASRWPAGAAADLVKVDIVLVKERDRYGLPRWDTMKRVAHLEFSRARLLAALPKDTPALSPGELAIFTKIELF